MTNVETRMTKDSATFWAASFGFLSSFWIRHSGFFGHCTFLIDHLPALTGPRAVDSLRSGRRSNRRL